MPVEPLAFVLLPLVVLTLSLVRLGRAPFGEALKIAFYIIIEWLFIVLWGLRLEAIAPHEHYLARASMAFIPLFAGAMMVVSDAFAKREAQLFPEVPMPVFQDASAAGRGCESLLLRLVRSRRLVVTVTENELWIRPAGRWSWLSRIGGLVHRMSLLHIHQLERLETDKANIRLEYGASDGWCRCIELSLKNPTAFIEAVREGQIETAA